MVGSGYASASLCILKELIKEPNISLHILPINNYIPEKNHIASIQSLIDIPYENIHPIQHYSHLNEDTTDSFDRNFFIETVIGLQNTLKLYIKYNQILLLV